MFSRLVALSKCPLRPMLLLSLGLSLGGCALLNNLGGALEAYQPTVSFQRMSLTSIDFEKVGLDFVFRIDNPNPVSVTSSSFTYDLALEGHKLMAGDQAKGIQLKSKGPSEVALPVSVVFSDIAKLLGATKGKDALDYTLTGAFGFNTPLGPVSIPYETAGDFPMLHKPEVRMVGLRVQGIQILKQTATLALDVGVTNKEGGGTLQLNGFNYALDLAGARVASGGRPKLPAVGKGQESVVSLPITLNLGQIGAGLSKIITGRQNVGFRLVGDVGVGTPWGAVPLKFNRSGTIPITGSF